MKTPLPSTIRNSAIAMLTCLAASVSISQADVIFSQDFSALNDGDAITFENSGFTPAFTGGVQGTWTKQTANGMSTADFAGASDGNSGGTLTTSFTPIVGAFNLTLNGGWLYGNPNSGSNSLSIAILDGSGNGYAFTDIRGNGYQYALITGYNYSSASYISVAGNTTQTAVAAGGTLEGLTLTRSATGDFTFKLDNQPDGTGVAFTDLTTTTFSQFAIIQSAGGENSVQNFYTNITLNTVPEPSTLAVLGLGIAVMLITLQRRRRALLNN